MAIQHHFTAHKRSVSARALAAGLLLSSLGVAAPALAKTAEWTVMLTGKAEVPGPGHASATGTAKVTVDDSTNNLCYDIMTKGLDNASAAHVHKGAVGVAGPVVVPLQAPVGGATKACASIAPALAGAIMASPGDYYVNVHSPDFPAGAIRAQLGG